MRAESLSAAAASLALGAVLVLSSVHAGRLLLEDSHRESTAVVATEPAFETVDVAHLLETESRTADARREPQPQPASTPKPPTGAAGPGTSESGTSESGTSDSGSPTLVEGPTAADEPAGAPGLLRPAAQPSPDAEPARADAERRSAEPSAPTQRIRALSGAAGSTQRVVEPDRRPRSEPEPHAGRERSAPDADPSPRGDRAPGRSRSHDDAPRGAAPERAVPGDAVGTPAGGEPVPRAAPKPVDQDSGTPDERVTSASLEVSRPPLHAAAESAPEDHDAAPLRATARRLDEPRGSEEIDAEQPQAESAEKAKAETAEAEKPQREADATQAADSARVEPEPEPSKPEKPAPDPPAAEPATPATPATPAEPELDADEPHRPARPPVEPATPAQPAQPAADPAAGPPDDRTEADG